MRLVSLKNLIAPALLGIASSAHAARGILSSPVLLRTASLTFTQNFPPIDTGTNFLWSIQYQIQSTKTGTYQFNGNMRNNQNKTETFSFPQPNHYTSAPSGEVSTTIDATLSKAVTEEYQRVGHTVTLVIEWPETFTAKAGRFAKPKVLSLQVRTDNGSQMAVPAGSYSFDYHADA